jgi:hypothetical protein
MILSAIGLPVPGTPNASFPLTFVERPEMSVQAITPTTASGGSASAQGSDVGRNAGGKGETGNRRSVQDSPPDVRRDRDRTGVADRPAGPQPAFEIAVLEKLREDVMRMPTDKPVVDTDDLAAPAQGAVPADEPSASGDPDPTVDAAAARSSSAADGNLKRGDPGDRTDRTVAADDSQAEPARTDRREAQDAAEKRLRDPADDRFDDARRMSENPSRRSLDLTS